MSSVPTVTPSNVNSSRCECSNNTQNTRIAAITASVVAALLIVSTLFLCLTLLGIDFGGINALRTIDPSWIYGGIGITFLASGIAIFGALKLTRKFLDTQHSYQLAEATRLFGEEQVSEKSPPGSYWEMDIKGNPPYYALFVKDREQKEGIMTFNNDEERTAYILTLTGFLNAKKP